MVGRGLRCISSLSLGEECRFLKGIMFPWGATTGSECCFLIFCLHPPAASSKQGALLSRVPRPCCCGRALVSKRAKPGKEKESSFKNTQNKILMDNMYILGRVESNIFQTFLTCNIYKRENNWAMKHWRSFKKTNKRVETEEKRFYLHPESPCEPFLHSLDKLGLATQEWCPLLRQKQSREGERERESMRAFRNTRIRKSSLAKVTWLRLWAKESGTHPVERAGRVLCLLWKACEKWEQNQAEEEKALSSHRPESSRYRTSGPWQTCEREKDRTKERKKLKRGRERIREQWINVL